MKFHIPLLNCFPTWISPLAGFALVLFLAPMGQAADGDLDPSFGSGGKVTTMHLSGGDDSASAAVRQNDGKLVVGGRFTLARYNVNGTLDTSFGGSGHVAAPFGVKAVAVQPDGKILVAGTGQDGQSFAAARLTASGALDAAFGTKGVVTTKFGQSGAEGEAIGLQADGKIVCAGSVNQHFALVRYLAGGSLDTTFGSGGKVMTQVSSQAEQLLALAIQADGKLVAAGGLIPGVSSITQNQGEMVRYNANGSLDSSFGTGGKGSYHFALRSITLQPDGKIVGTGSTRVQAGNSQDGFGIVRVNSDGLIDAAFGSNGIAVTAFGALEAQALAVVVQPDGKILAAGDSIDDGIDRAAIAMARYNTNGTLDPTFGATGKVLTHLGDIPSERVFSFAYAPTSPAHALIVQPDGHIITIGEARFTGTGQDVVLFRYDAQGKADAAFGRGGLVQSNLAGSFDVVHAVIVQPDGKVIAAGGEIAGSAQFDLVRYNSDGSVDASFGSHGHAVARFGDASGELPAGATSIALQSDGKIVVAGEVLTLANGGNFGIARFNPNGTLDSTFGTAGLVTLLFNGSGGDFLLLESEAGPAHLVIQPDGRILLVGTKLRSDTGDAGFNVARFKSDGTADPSFGTKGTVTTTFENSFGDVPAAVALQPDGKIVVAGNRDGAIELARYASNGSLDPTFGKGGKATASSDLQAIDVALTPEGKIVVLLNAADDIAFERFSSNGSVDTAFGAGGKVTSDFGKSESGNSLKVESDGRLLVAGESYDSKTDQSSFLVARYTGDGKLDPRFGSGGFVTTDFTGGGGFANALAIAPDGKLVAAGTDGSFALARYLSSPPPAAKLANISTRLRVETGDNVLIGGFIVTGTQPKKVLIRAIGPSLPVSGKLADPTLALYSGSSLLESNDNWVDSRNKQAIIATTIPPSNNLESAIVRTLPANNSAYTAVVRGVSNGTGVGLVEVYDLDGRADSKLANISTRGLVETGDNAMIGGFIVLNGSQKVIVRAIGPSLGIAGALADPTLELHDHNGTLLQSNNDWRTNQQAEIIATTVPPKDQRESAIVRTLSPGNYTAVVRGVNNTTGVALVEVFALQ